jgi:hypothetical protein
MNTHSHYDHASVHTPQLLFFAQSYSQSCQRHGTQHVRQHATYRNNNKKKISLFTHYSYSFSRNRILNLANGTASNTYDKPLEQRPVFALTLVSDLIYW